MPVISYFFGIYIRMYHADHPPAHFHAEYQGHEAFIAIETGAILQGHLPAKAARIVQELAPGAPCRTACKLGKSA